MAIPKLKTEYQEIIFLPNSIFSDLSTIPKGKHRAFAYSYYYYISYLYRYCRYASDHDKITQGDIKSTLGYSSDSKDINFLIKKNGVLDEIGYTESTTDYPVRFELNEFNDVQFQTVSDLRNTMSIPNERNYKIKFPIKAFYTCNEAKSNNILDGHFYDLHNTHAIPFNTFSFFMNSELKTIGLYVYGYLKYQCYTFSQTQQKGFQRSLELISSDLKLSRSTINETVKALEQYGYIRVQHEDYVSNLQRSSRNKSMRANTYFI